MPTSSLGLTRALYRVVMTPRERQLIVLFTVPKVCLADEAAIAVRESNLSFSSTKIPRSLSLGTASSGRSLRMYPKLKLFSPKSRTLIHLDVLKLNNQVFAQLLSLFISR